MSRSLGRGVRVTAPTSSEDAARPGSFPEQRTVFHGSVARGPFGPAHPPCRRAAAREGSTLLPHQEHHRHQQRWRKRQADVLTPSIPTTPAAHQTETPNPANAARRTVRGDRSLRHHGAAASPPHRESARLSPQEQARVPLPAWRRSMNDMRVGSGFGTRAPARQKAVVRCAS